MCEIIKKILYFLLYFPGIHLLIKKLYKHRVLILMYHGLVEDKTGREWTQLPVAEFKKQMVYLSRNFNVVSLDDAVAYLSDRTEIPSNPVVITFDDGYSSNYTLGREIMSGYDMPATVFIATSLIDEKSQPGKLLWFDMILDIVNLIPQGELDLERYELGKYDLRTGEDRHNAAERICDNLKTRDPESKNKIIFELVSHFGSDLKIANPHLGATWDQITDALPLFTAGAHTVNHDILAQLSPERARLEIDDARRIIEDKIGRRIRFFAYPNGRQEDFTPENKRMVGESGFRAALTTIEGFNDPGDDLFELKRIGVASDTDMLWFKMAVTGTIDFLKRLKM